VKIFPEWYFWFGSRTWLTTSCVLYRKSTELTWDEDEPSAAAEEESAPTIEESAPAPQAVSEASPVKATLP
jgi:hypothetical protein